MPFITHAYSFSSIWIKLVLGRILTVAVELDKIIFSQFNELIYTRRNIRSRLYCLGTPNSLKPTVASCHCGRLSLLLLTRCLQTEIWVWSRLDCLSDVKLNFENTIVHFFLNFQLFTSLCHEQCKGNLTYARGPCKRNSLICHSCSDLLYRGFPVNSYPSQVVP